jgi:hypothetical protein
MQYILRGKSTKNKEPNMKKILVILLTVITLAQTNRAGAQVYGSISFNTFYNELSPYGRWVNDLDYGQVWIADEPGFEPYYNNGHWVYTSYGWTWVSDYRWGWAPFHYGRWTYLPTWGEWAWIPGYEWGPAWVGWCQNDGYYGWAPLGPGMGLNFTFNSIPRNYWRFVQQRYITVPSVRNHIIRPDRDQRVFRNAVVINNTQVNNNVRYEAGPQREAVERITRRKIEPKPVAFTAADEQTQVDKRAVRIYRPELKPQQATNNAAVKPSPANQPAIAPATRPAIRPDERPITRDQRVKPVPGTTNRTIVEQQPVRKADEPTPVTAPVQRNNEVQNLPPRITQRPDDMRQQRMQQAQERQKQQELQRANDQQNLRPQREQQQDEIRLQQARQEQLRQQQAQQQQRELQQQRQNELKQQQQLEQQQARQQAIQQQKEQQQQQLRQQQAQEQQQLRQQQLQEQRQNELRQQQQERQQQLQQQRQDELRRQQQEERQQQLQQQRQMQQRQNEMRQQQRIQEPPMRQERIVPMNQRPNRKPNGNG